MHKRGLKHHRFIDDGETGAGGTLLRILQDFDIKNTMVTVSRWYGGQHLGTRCFAHIETCTKQALSRLTGSIDSTKCTQNLTPTPDSLRSVYLSGELLILNLNLTWLAAVEILRKNDPPTAMNAPTAMNGHSTKHEVPE